MKFETLRLYIFGGIILFIAAITAIVFFLLPPFSSQEKEDILSIPEEEQVSQLPILDGKNTKPQTTSSKKDDNKTETNGYSAIFSECKNKDFSNEEKQKCDDEKFLDQSIANSSTESCLKIRESDKKEFCTDSVTFAKIKRNKETDSSSCENMKTTAMKGKCIRTTSINQLNQAKTKDECESIPEEDISSECFKKFLTVEDFHFSPLKCDSLDNASEKVFCQQMTIEYALKNDQVLRCERIEGMEEFCTQRKNLYKNRENFTKATETLNLEFCSKITEAELRKNCKDSLLPLMAWDKKDIAFCELVSTTEKREKCRKKNIEPISIFFYDKARNEGAEKYCLKILDSEWKKKCTDIFL